MSPRSAHRGAARAGRVDRAAAPAAPTLARADVFGPISLGVGRARSSRPTTRTTRRSRATGATSPSTGRSAGSRASGGATCDSGEVEQVAGGDAELPSISADGRYISFTTSARLTPGDHERSARRVRARHGHRLGAGVLAGERNAESCAFALASAVDGRRRSAQLRRYERTGPLRIARRGPLGAERRRPPRRVRDDRRLGPDRSAPARSTDDAGAAGRGARPRQPATTSSSASADARPVPKPRPVSAEEAGKPVGAVFTKRRRAAAVPRRSKRMANATTVGASISADGSTVAWMGDDIAEQAPQLAGEAPPPRYTEPLWRRIAGGPGADPARHRRLGPGGPACAASGETRSPANRRWRTRAGPVRSAFSESADPGLWSERLGSRLPSRSSAPTATRSRSSPTRRWSCSVPNFGAFAQPRATCTSPTCTTASRATRRCAALTRARQRQQLGHRDATRRSSTSRSRPTAPRSRSRRKRTVFPLGVAGVRQRARGRRRAWSNCSTSTSPTRRSRASRRATKAARANTRTCPNRPAKTPTPRLRRCAVAVVLRRRATLAFSSTASNLVYGDGNTPPLGHESATFDGTDAFVVSRVLFGSQRAGTYISPAPAGPGGRSRRGASASAPARAATAACCSTSQLPGAGLLRAAAARCASSCARTAARARDGAAPATSVVSADASRPAASQRPRRRPRRVDARRSRRATARSRAGRRARRRTCALVFTAPATRRCTKRSRSSFAGQACATRARKPGRRR